MRWGDDCFATVEMEMEFLFSLSGSQFRDKFNGNEFYSNENRHGIYQRLNRKKNQQLIAIEAKKKSADLLLFCCQLLFLPMRILLPRLHATHLTTGIDTSRILLAQ